MQNKFLVIFITIIIFMPEVLSAKTSGNKTNFSLSGGVTINSGNKNSRVINTSSKLKSKVGSFGYFSKFELFYGKSGDELIYNKAKWRNNFSNALGKTLNLFGTLGLEYDTVEGVALRHNIGLGLESILIKKKKHNAKLSASFNTEASQEVSGRSNNSLRIELSYYAVHKFSSTAKLSMESTLTSNLRKISEDFRIESTASISLLMKKPVWLKVKVVDKYTNSPLTLGNKKNDLTLITAIEMSI